MSERNEHIHTQSGGELLSPQQFVDVFSAQPGSRDLVVPTQTFHGDGDRAHRTVTLTVRETSSRDVRMTPGTRVIVARPDFMTVTVVDVQGRPNLRARGRVSVTHIENVGLDPHVTNTDVQDFGRSAVMDLTVPEGGVIKVVESMRGHHVDGTLGTIDQMDVQQSAEFHLAANVYDAIGPVTQI